MENFPHKELSRSLIGIAYELHRHLGPGFLEAVYEEAFCLELEKRNIGFQRQREIEIRYKGVSLHKKCKADIIVENMIIVENKATTGLTDVDTAQMLNYLRATGIRVGLLFNFGRTKLEFTRRIV